MSPKRWLIILTASVLAAAGCARAALPARQADGPEVVEQRALRAGADEAEAPAAPAAIPAGEPMPQEGGGDLATFDRMVIRRANLTLGVESSDAALARIRSLVAGSGGFVSHVQTWKSEDQLFATLTVRIPAQVFDQVVEEIKDVAAEVRAESVSGQDVTEEYVDLTARLRNLEATEAELLALLTEVREKLKSVDQVLVIHRELGRVREEIERIEGRRQFLQNASDLASLTIELVPVAAKPPQPRPGWQPSQTVQEALERLGQALARIGDAAIWLALYLLPLAAIILGPVGAVAYAVRRMSGRTTPVSGPTDL